MTGAHSPGRPATRPAARAWAQPDGATAPWRVRLGGAWTIGEVGRLDREVVRLAPPRGVTAVELDLAALETLDTSGAWLVHRFAQRLRRDGATVELVAVPESQRPLLDQVLRAHIDCDMEPERPPLLIALAENVGRWAVSVMAEARALIGFLGYVVATLGRVLIDPRRLRLTSVVHHMQYTGLNALAIVGLLGLLLGIVIAYQGAYQLRRFGAEMLVVNLVGVSVFRELGVLITAIIVAGRSGSAFTAQIGTMIINQEVDAMRTIGLDPGEVLVVPRILGLMLVMPLLAFYASIAGLVGGAAMGQFVLGISFGSFLQQLQETVNPAHFWIGMAKAPVFAFTIAMVGCYQGFKVTGSAESVGHLTTRSVVVSLFLVILLDAVFSVVFAQVGFG